MPAADRQALVMLQVSGAMAWARRHMGSTCLAVMRSSRNVVNAAIALQGRFVIAESRSEWSEAHMETVVDEPYTIGEVAKKLRVNPKTIRRLFQHEPGVIVIATPRKGCRTYRTIRIPHAVLQRVLTRLTR